MELLVYNHDLELIGIIDDAKSIIWHRRYYTAGDFEIILPVNEINIELIQKQYIITKNDSVECGVIENITIEQSDDGELLKAIGRFGSSLLSRRIVFNTTIINDTYENAMRQLVYKNAINPDIADRIIPNLLLGTLNSFTDLVQFQVSYRNLLTTLNGLSETSGIGFRIRLNPADKKFYFETYKALDRSVNQSVNPRVIFSNDYDNLLASIYQSSDMEYSNVALVGGEGEGEDRKMVIVGSGAGLNRYEVFVNAKEVRMEDGITEPDYYAMLATKGAESLVPKVEYFEGNVLAESNVIYKSDYDLGDIVTIENTKWNKRINVQITEITEVYDENGIQVIPVFGQSSPTLSESIPERDTSGSSVVNEIVVSANKVLVSDSEGKIVSSSISDTELEYLSGVTSSIQTQLNSKAVPSDVSLAVATAVKGQDSILPYDINRWEQGGYAGATGSPTATTADIRSKTTINIPILPNTDYVLSCSASLSYPNTGIVVFNSSNVFLGYYAINDGERRITTPATAAYFRVRATKADLSTFTVNEMPNHFVRVVRSIFPQIYPIGSIYISVVNTNPNTFFGGTWVAFGTGRVLVGVDTGQTEFNTVEKTGGAKTHTLTVSEMPAHTHDIRYDNDGGAGTTRQIVDVLNTPQGITQSGSTGGGAAHNNLQPYITVYMWKRTA